MLQEQYVCIHLQFTECGIDMNENINCTSQKRNVFTKFQEQFLSEDVIKWRYHSAEKDIVCMNDIDSDTGVLIPNSCNMYKELFW